MKAAKKTDLTDLHSARREAVLQATFACFLELGFTKTSVDRVAARLKIARPLVYLLFRNKDALFREAMQHAFSSFIAAGRRVAQGNLGRREKLIQVYEAMVIQPWHRIMIAPAAMEFHEHCYRLFPEIETEADAQVGSLLVEIFEDKKVAEVFKLAVDGQRGDLPSAATLRRRIHMVIDRFVGDESPAPRERQAKPSRRSQ